MALGKKIDMKQTATLAAVVMGAGLLVSWIFATFLKAIVQPLFSAIPATTGITSTVGVKVLGLISGIIPLGDLIGFGLLATFISAFLVILVGEYSVDNFKLPTFKGFAGINGRVGRLASVIIYGSVALYVVLAFMANTSVSLDLMVYVGLAIYTFIQAVAAVWIANLLKLKI